MIKSDMLIVDDSRFVHTLVRTCLEPEPLAIHSVYDGASAMSAVAELQPRLVLLDLGIPGTDGFEVCRRLKADPRTTGAAVMFLTGDASLQNKLKGLRLGAVDYVTKPFEEDTLRARVRLAVRLQHRAERSALIDPLTGLWNESYLGEHLAAQLTRAGRSGSVTACITADVETLARDDEQFDDIAGEEILRAVADTLLRQCRGSDDTVFYRGGRKFTALLAGTDRAARSVWPSESGSRSTTNCGATTRTAWSASGLALRTRRPNPKCLCWTAPAPPHACPCHSHAPLCLDARGEIAGLPPRSGKNESAEPYPGAQIRNVILLIDDSTSVHHLVKAHLSPRFEIVSAYDGKAGLVSAVKHLPDVILLDVEMPAMQGYAVCRRLKANRITRAIPVVFLTSARSVSERIRGLDAGACDYITKPFEPTELRARIRAVLRTEKTMSELTQNSMVDALTGLFDRRYFETQLDCGLAGARRTGRPLGCIVADIDQMHAVNGAFGRELGDQMLCAVSERLAETCRREDVLCRFGGDEFVVLVPDTTESSLADFAERVRRAVRSATVFESERVIRVTASLGVARSSLTDDVTVFPAEDALCQAKHAGGDCIRFGAMGVELRAAA